MENQDGLVFIGKGVTLKEFFEGIANGEPLPKIDYLVQDLEPGSDLASITCWKQCDCVFDISEDVVDLFKSWLIHKEWHKEKGSTLLKGSDPYPDEFLKSFTTPPLDLEVKRIDRMKKYTN